VPNNASGPKNASVPSGVVVMPPDDLVGRLVEDHRAIASRFTEFHRLGTEGRAEWFWKLTDQLVRHEVAEELIVYPVLREIPGGVGVADARIAEQAEAECRLAQMESLDPTSDEFAVEQARLMVAVLNHAEREESEAFRLLPENVSSERLIALGNRYAAARNIAPTHPHTRLPDEPPGNKVAQPLAALIDRVRDAVSGV